MFSREIDVQEFLRRARHHREFLLRKLGEAKVLSHEAERRSRERAGSAGEARLECAQAYLPAFDPLSLATAERLLHLPAGWANDRVRLVQAEDQKLEKRIAEIEGDDRYQFRESYLGEGGEWRQELAAAEKAEKTAHDHAARFEVLPRFHELIRSGYGTASYRPGCMGFFDPNPKAAAQVMAVLGKGSWEEVRNDYEVARETRVKKKHTLDEVKARVAALEELVAKRQAALERRAALAGTAPLEDSRADIAQHLERADRRELARTAKAAGRQDLLAALAKLDGLSAQADYLLSMGRDASEVQAIEEEIGAVDRDIEKYQRPKKAGTRFPLDRIEKRFRDRPGRLEKRLARRRKLMERAYAYDDWDPSYDWDDPVPWWFYIVGRNDPGYGFTDVSHFLRHRPSYVFARPTPILSDSDDDTDDDAYDAAAAAAALAQGSGTNDRDIS